VAAVVARLRAAGCVFAEDEARLLVDAAGEAARAAVDRGAALEMLVARRVAGEPLEQVLGWVEFCGHRIVVAPGVFVPRRRSQLLATQAIVVARGRSAPVVVELCCGVAAVAAVLGAALADAQLHAADVDPAAVAGARRNLPGGSTHLGDLYTALPPALAGRIDVLVANAPYVPTAAIALMPPEARLYEPALALDGGADGLELHRRIAADAPHWLAPDGVLLIETSAEQAAGTAGLVAGAGLTPEIVRDDEVDGTVVLGRRAGPDRGAV
jgi:release factor glutamine methyltransferase